MRFAAKAGHFWEFAMGKTYVRRFSVHSNFACEVLEAIGGKEVVYDTHLENYGKCVQAFLKKRRVSKTEVAPKIYILEALPALRQTLGFQALMDMKVLLTQDRLKKSFESG